MKMTMKCNEKTYPVFRPSVRDVVVNRTTIIRKSLDKAVSQALVVGRRGREKSENLLKL